MKKKILWPVLLSVTAFCICTVIPNTTTLATDSTETIESVEAIAVFEPILNESTNNDISIQTTLSDIESESFRQLTKAVKEMNDFNYYNEMMKCVKENTPESFAKGAEYEQKRNTKIDSFKLPYEKTSYFTTYKNCREIQVALKSEIMKQQYPTAGLVYETFAKLGYSDPVIAGILGNMMLECGGQTLKLNSTVWNPGHQYYGLCQWSKRYHPNVIGLDTVGQLNYLTGNIEHYINSFGGNYQYFLSMQDPGEVAKYFNKYYEIGNGGAIRAQCGYKALNWINSIVL